MANQTEIEISQDLASQFSSRISKTQFNTLSEYIEFVLEEILAEMEPRDEDEDSGVDSKEVEDRLKSLGYLDS